MRSQSVAAAYNDPVILSSHCGHLKLRHRFHALLKVCDDIVPLSG